MELLRPGNSVESAFLRMALPSVASAWLPWVTINVKKLMLMKTAHICLGSVPWWDTITELDVL